MAELEPLLDKGKPMTAKAMRTLFQGKSANTKGFMMVVLIAEGLLKVSQENPQSYERIDPAEFKC